MGFNTYDEQLITAGDLSLASLTSAISNMDMMIGCAIQCIFSGTATGNVNVQASCDPIQMINGQPPNVTNWTTVSTTALAAPGTLMLNISNAYYKWLRVTYARTGGTGSLTVNLHAKGA